MKATVIGGGIGGPAIALGLIQHGWEVSVWEKAGQPDRSGAALGMWPEAMRALDTLGLKDQIRARSELCRSGRVVSLDGSVLARIGRSVRMIARGDLLEILHAALPPDTVRWGSGFQPGIAPPTDLLVAADGINSPVRSVHWPPIAPRPLGTVAFRGNVAGSVDTLTETWIPGGIFGITPSGRPGRINWYASLRAELTPSRGADTAAFLRTFFAGAHPGLCQVLEQLQPESIDRRRLSDVSVRGGYVRGRAVLIGDAAHAMAPNLGRGACETLVDAVTLVQALRDHGDVDLGLRAYDRARRGRTRRMVIAARALNRLATASRGVGLRDGLLRTLSRGFFDRLGDP